MRCAVVIICSVCIISNKRKGVVWLFQSCWISLLDVHTKHMHWEKLSITATSTQWHVSCLTCCYKVSRENSLSPVRYTELVALTDRFLGRFWLFCHEILAVKLGGMGFNKDMRIASSSAKSRVWNDSWFQSDCQIVALKVKSSLKPEEWRVTKSELKNNGGCFVFILMKMLSKWDTYYGKIVMVVFIWVKSGNMRQCSQVVCQSTQHSPFL